MIAQYLNNKNFLKRYLDNYALRQAIANMQLEKKEAEMVTQFEGNEEMEANIEGFDYIINSNPNKVTPYDLNEISYRVNNGFFQKGFRKTQVEVSKAKNFFPISAMQVPQAIYSLFDSYHNIWTDLPIYEKEARLHIEIVRIQPYEDGNKRSARILTSYNLCKQDKAPVIIPGRDTDEYFDYIDRYDVAGMTKYLENRSKEELQYMLNYYKKLVGDKIEESEPSSYTDDRDIKKYVFKRDEK